MTKLMRIDEYINTRYTPGSRPCKRAVIRQISEGELPGRRLGKFYYVDVDMEQRLTGNPLVDNVLLSCR